MSDYIVYKLRTIVAAMLYMLMSTIGFSQTPLNTPQQKSAGLTETEFRKAKIEFAAMAKTEMYKQDRKATCEIMIKVNRSMVPDLSDAYAWEAWIAKNIKSTKFKSIREAQDLRKKSLQLTQQNLAENFALYEMIKKANAEQLYEILEPERHYAKY